MAELASLKNFALQGLQYRPADVTGIVGSAVPKLVPDLSAAAASQGAADMLDRTSAMVAELPKKALEGSKAGREMGREQYLADLYKATGDKAAEGDPQAQGALADFTVGPQGIQYKPVSPVLRDLELQVELQKLADAKANNNLKAAQTKWWEDRPPAPPSLYDELDKKWRAQSGGSSVNSGVPIPELPSDLSPIPEGEILPPLEPPSLDDLIPGSIPDAPQLSNNKGPNGGTLVKSPSGIFTETLEDGSRYVVTPGARAPRFFPAKENKGFTFETVEEANKYAETNGFAPPKVTNVNGKIVATEMTPKEVDGKGKAKLTDSMKKMLGSGSELVSDLADLESRHAKLYDENKAGPLAGRWEKFKADMGYGDREFVNARGQIDVGQFKIARLLNGPGVLTDKDIQRAQGVAPTLTDDKDTFQAKMKNVRRMLSESINTWITINEASAGPELVKAARDAISAVEGGTAIQRPSAGTSQASPVKQKHQQMLESGTKEGGKPLTPQEAAAIRLRLNL